MFAVLGSVDRSRIYPSRLRAGSCTYNNPGPWAFVCSNRLRFPSRLSRATQVYLGGGCNRFREHNGLGDFSLAAASLWRIRSGLDLCFKNSAAFFFQAEDGIRDKLVTGVQTCALPI